MLDALEFKNGNAAINLEQRVNVAREILLNRFHWNLELNLVAVGFSQGVDEEVPDSVAHSKYAKGIVGERLARWYAIGRIPMRPNASAE
jgi:hypothetical protein